MAMDKKNYNILVIEDNSGDFMIVEDLLNEQILNPCIVQAETYAQAITILSDRSPLFDIILLDLTLPDKNGDALITDMLQMAPLCPVIILTGYADIDFSIKSISQGIFDYLVKDD